MVNLWRVASCSSAPWLGSDTAPEDPVSPYGSGTASGPGSLGEEFSGITFYTPLYPTLPHSTSLYLTLPPYISTYFHIFPHISTYFHIFPHISTYFHLPLSLTTPPPRNFPNRKSPVCPNSSVYFFDLCWASTELVLR